MNKTKEKQTHLCREHMDGCQREGGRRGGNLKNDGGTKQNETKPFKYCVYYLHLVRNWARLCVQINVFYFTLKDYIICLFR